MENDECPEVVQKYHNIWELLPSDDKAPFTKVKIAGEEVLVVNESSSWEIEKILTNYRQYDNPPEVFIVVFKRKMEERTDIL